MRGRGHDAGLRSLEGEGSGSRGDEGGELTHGVKRRGFNSVEGVGVAERANERDMFSIEDEDDEEERNAFSRNAVRKVDSKMICETLSDSRKVDLDVDSESFELCSRTDTGEEKDLRRDDGSR